MSKIKDAKNQRKIATIFAYTGLAIAVISLLLLAPIDASFPVKMRQVILSLFSNNGNMMFLVCGIMATLGLTSLISTLWAIKSSKQFLMNNNDENIQSQIDQKKKQKDLAKQNSKSNEQKLSELDKRQTEINLEIDKCEAKLLLYEELTTQLVNEFLDNIDRLEKRDKKVKVYNEFSPEYDCDYDIDVPTITEEEYEEDTLEEAIDSSGTIFKKRNKQSQRKSKS